MRQRGRERRGEEERRRNGRGCERVASFCEEKDGVWGKSWLSLKLSSGRWRSFSLSPSHLSSLSRPFVLVPPRLFHILAYLARIYSAVRARDMPIKRDGAYTLFPIGQTINLRVRTERSIPVSVYLRLIKSPPNLGSPTVRSFVRGIDLPVRVFRGKTRNRLHPCPTSPPLINYSFP